jgi:hypothetical protein
VDREEAALEVLTEGALGEVQVVRLALLTNMMVPPADGEADGSLSRAVGVVGVQQAQEALAKTVL